jgi:hypothetical protein
MIFQIHQEGYNEKKQIVSVGQDVKEWNLYALLMGL